MSALHIADRGVLVPCPSCGRVNRLAFGHLNKTGRCPDCKQSLPSPSAPVEVASGVAFDRLVGTSALPVVVDYWAPWCGPCRAVAPELDVLARQEQGRWLIAKVNTDALPDLGARFGIRSIPTMVVFDHGREIARASGARPAPAIRAFVAQALETT